MTQEYQQATRQGHKGLYVYSSLEGKTGYWAKLQ